MDPVALWLLSEVVAPDAYSAIRQAVFQRTTYEKIAGDVRQQTGRRVSRRYKRWLQSESTWDDLVSRSSDAYTRLVNSLAEAEAARLIRAREPDRDAAAELVNATILHFLPSLDPSLAVAVTDARSEERHSEVIARLDAKATYTDRLERLPPPARAVLQEGLVDHAAAEKLVLALTSGDASSVISSLIDLPPAWLADAPPQVVVAAGEVAEAYGLPDRAAVMFEEAGDLGYDRHRSYARAALLVAEDQPDQSGALLERARASGPGVWAAAVAAAVAGEWDRVLEAVRREDAVADLLLARLYWAALAVLRGEDEAVSFLSDVIEMHAESAGIKLALARLLLSRSERPGTTSRVQDRRSAGELAEQARDLRRAWHGPSGEALIVACHAALLAQDYERVVELGSPSPTGTALATEAAVPEVQFAVAQASLALGQQDRASDIAERATGFDQALLHADIRAEAGAPSEELERLYHAAWALADDEQARIAVWTSAAIAGLEPVPGTQQLVERHDSIRTYVEALIDIAHDRVSSAIARLRPLRDDERARRLLADAYLRAERVDDAVAELLDAAERFDNPDHLIRAAEVLLAADRLEDAAPIADRVLPLLGDAPRRTINRLHEIGIAHAHNRGAWKEMEERARAWIQAMGPDPRVRWLLIQALINQSEPHAAWTVFREAGELSPESAMEARLWTALNAEFNPKSRTLSMMLALCERFHDDLELRAEAINAFLLRSAEEVEVPPEELTRWHGLMQERLERPGDRDFFVSIQTSEEEPEALVAALRDHLEPHVLRVKEAQKRVREGWPYGFLAAAAGRTYTAALVHRGAGFLAPFTPSMDERQQEVQAAREAIDAAVVIDLSALAIGHYLQSLWPQLVGSFSRIQLVGDARRDVAGASRDLRPRSTRTLSWDLDRGRPVLAETSAEEFEHIEAHIQWVESTARTLSVADTPAESPDIADANTFGSWLGSAEFAAAAHLPLWADDVGLRRVGRAEGAPAFGTDALLSVLTERRLIAQEQHDEALTTLRDNYCVDLPLDADWVMQRAERDEWRPGVAQFAFSRAATWSDLQDAFECWRGCAAAAGTQSADLVADWVYAATFGLCQAVEGDLARRLVAGLLVTAAGAVRSASSEFARCVEAVKSGCEEHGVDQPIALALRMILDLLREPLGQEQASSSLARLGADITGDDRATLRQILFDLPP